MTLQENISEDTLTAEYLIITCTILASYFIYRKSFSRKRLNAVRSRPSLQTQPHHIIVAWEIDHLLVELSDRKKPGFSRVELETKGFNYAFEKMKELFGMGIFYKPRTTMKNLKLMLQSLADNPKVRLFLYTTLDLRVAEAILDKLYLLNFFSTENRRSCNDRYSEALKHPTEVDYNTKRVVMLTGSRKDHLEDHSKYFLVVRAKEIGESVRELNRIISKNEDIDELHNQLAHHKALVESDCQAYE